MKRLLLTLVCILTVSAAALAQQPGVVIGKINPDSYKKSEAKSMVTSNIVPQDVRQFEALKGAIAVTPQGAAMALFMAVDAMREDPELGEKLLGGILIGNRSSKMISLIKEKVASDEFFPRRFYKGATAANGYTPFSPVRIDVTVSKESYDKDFGSIKLILAPSGGGSASITVKKAGDQFKVMDFELNL